MATRGATSEVHPSHVLLVDVRVATWAPQGEAVLPVSTKGPTRPAFEVSLDLFGASFVPDPSMRSDIWYEDEEPREIDDPPTSDLGPPLTREEI